MYFLTDDQYRIFLILFSTPVVLIGLYWMHKDSFTFTRFIIFKNGFIPPTQYFFDFFNRKKHMKFFNDIAEMQLLQVADKPISYNFRFYLNNNQVINIYHNQLEKYAMEFFLKLKHEKFPDERRQYCEEAERMILNKKYDEALKLINLAIDINPNNKEYWNIKGVALGELQRYEESLEAFNKSLYLYPKNRTGWENKAFALENLGRLQEAVDCYNKAMELTRFHKSDIRGKRDKIIHSLMYKQKE